MRRSRILLFGMLALIAIPVLSGGPRAYAAAPQPFRVMMILWRGCEDACHGFRDYLRSRDIPVKYIMHAVRGGPAAVSELVDVIEGSKTDLVVTWGPEITEALVGEYDRVDPNRHLTEVPVLFMMVPDPVAARIVPGLESSGRNVSGTLLLAPEEAQVQAWRAYRPFKRLGIIVDGDDPASLLGLQRMQMIAARNGFTLATREVASRRAGRPDPDDLRRLVGALAADGADCLYLGAEWFLQSSRDAITDEALQRRLPVVSTVPQAVTTSNALMSLVSRPGNVGWLTGALAEEILVEGRDPSDIPIRGLGRFSLLVNMGVAERLDMYPGTEILRTAEIIPVGDQ